MSARLPLPELDALPLGAVRVVPIPGARGMRASLLVTRLEDGPRVYWNTCTHLPVPLDSGTGALPEADGLVCLTHGASYDKADGRCRSGPCRGGLEAVPIQGGPGGWVALLEAP